MKQVHGRTIRVVVANDVICLLLSGLISHEWDTIAAGIVGTGLLSVPVLAGSASYALSESNGWTTGLNKKLKKAYAFYGVIIISMLLGLLMNFVGIDPIKMLIYSAVANGLIAPVILLLIVKMSSSKTVMGKHANGPVTATIGWVTTVVLFLVSGATVISFLL
jgi:Mn2+/Fe2+ NRAMP family transporter